VVAEVVDGASISRLCLNARGRIPTQTVVTHRQRVLVIEYPVHFRQDEFLIAGTRNWSGQSRQETERIVDLCVSQTAKKQRRAIRRAQVQETVLPKHRQAREVSFL